MSELSTQIDRYLQELVREGHDVTVVCQDSVLPSASRNQGAQWPWRWHWRAPSRRGNELTEKGFT